MDDELLDLVNNEDEVIGQIRRSEAWENAIANVRVVNVFVENSHGQRWIPRRTAYKRMFPLCLDMSMGGHVEYSETYEGCLKRELNEELNLNLDQVDWQEIGYLSPCKHDVSAFMKVYQINSDDAPDYNRDDFLEAFWIEPKRLLENIANGEPAKNDLAKLVNIFYDLLLMFQVAG